MRSFVRTYRWRRRRRRRKKEEITFLQQNPPKQYTVGPLYRRICTETHGSSSLIRRMHGAIFRVRKWYSRVYVCIICVYACMLMCITTRVHADVHQYKCANISVPARQSTDVTLMSGGCCWGAKQWRHGEGHIFNTYYSRTVTIFLYTEVDTKLCWAHENL